MAEKKRIGWIDELKGFSMYTVILCHLNVYKPLRNWMVSFNMPIFFMVSGATLNIQKIENTSFKVYFSQLVKRLLVPYFWLQMLSFLTRYAVNLAGAHKEVPVLKYLKGILVGNNFIVGAPSNPLYYIYMLFLAQLGIWLVIRLAKGRKSYMMLLLTIFSLVSVCTQELDLPWHINGVPNVMLSIFIGRLLMDFYLHNKKKFDSLCNGNYLAISLALLVVGFVLSRINGKVSTHGNNFGYEYLLYLISGFSTTVGFALLAIRLPESRLFTFVGRNTLFYMGIHKPVLLLFEEVFEKYEDEMFFVIPASIVCFLLLVPGAIIANKYFPYINGNAIKKETTVLSLGKYVAVAAAWAVPYLYFNNHFMDGILRGSVAYQLFSAAAYIIGVIVVTVLINRFAPFIFISERKRINNAVRS